MYLKNKKLFFSLCLSIGLFYYLFFSIPLNLNDDHGIIINAGLQVSQGSFPGIDFPYPHGVLPPLIIGLFFKIFHFFNLSWQLPYFLISLFLFLFFVFILVRLINGIFKVSKYHSSLVSLLLVSFCLNPWGGIYFDYISINFCFIIIYLFFLGFNSIEESNKFNSKTAFYFFILGVFAFINPFFVKLTSVYISFATTICLTYLITFNRRFNQYKYKIFIYFFAGALILPFIILLSFLNNFDSLSTLILNILNPVFNADDLAQYSLVRLSPRDFIVPVFSLIALSTFLSLYNSKIYKSSFLIYKLLTFFFIFQYIQAWGRSRYWLFIAILFLCIKTLIEIKELKINKNVKLLLSIIFSSLTILNFSEFLRINRRIFLRQKQYKNNLILNFKDTNLSFFKIKQDTNWGVSSDVVEISKILKSKLENKQIKNYSYFDDNGFLIPLITGIKPVHKYTFFQINKTVFKNQPVNKNIYNLGRPDNLVICLPLKPETFNSNPDKFLKNQLNIEAPYLGLKINNSERYLRAKIIDKNFDVAKKIFLDFTDIYLKNYEMEFSNKSCALYKSKNQKIN